MPKVVMVKGKPVLRDDWHVEDIVMVAVENMEHDLSEKEAEEVMHLIAEDYDFTVGINWDVIENAVEEFIVLQGIKKG